MCVIMIHDNLQWIITEVIKNIWASIKTFFPLICNLRLQLDKTIKTNTVANVKRFASCCLVESAILFKMHSTLTVSFIFCHKMTNAFSRAGSYIIAQPLSVFN